MIFVLLAALIFGLFYASFRIYKSISERQAQLNNTQDEDQIIGDSIGMPKQKSDYSKFSG